MRASEAATPETDILPPEVCTSTFLTDSLLSDFVINGSFSGLNCAITVSCKTESRKNKKYFFMFFILR